MENGDVLAVNATGAVVSVMYGTYMHSSFFLFVGLWVGELLLAWAFVVVWERIKSVHAVVHHCIEEISTQLIGWVRSFVYGSDLARFCVRIFLLRQVKQQQQQTGLTYKHSFASSRYQLKQKVRYNLG